MKKALILLFALSLQASAFGQSKQNTSNFSLKLPDFQRPLPFFSQGIKVGRGFELRGTKGWAWTPEQYLAEIPFLVQFKMNFLMNCYLSMFTDPEKLVNNWWEPLPENKKLAYERVVGSCQENGIAFCFALHPQLFSERPLRHDNEEDFADLWQHYEWMQRLGVHWFSLSCDDISTEGWDRAKLAAAQAKLVNRLFTRLRDKDVEAQMIFCPTYYWGCGEEEGAQEYLQNLAVLLNREVFVFWTGDAAVTATITRECADAYKNLVQHRLILWDNYPVNDRTGALHLGPVTGRDRDLCEAAHGYMSNPLSPQNDINRIPLYTCADYAANPSQYDPNTSIVQAILFLAETSRQRRTLKNLVELYPGMLIAGDPRTSHNCAQAKFVKIIETGDQGRTVGWIQQIENVKASMENEFPGQYKNTLTTLQLHIDQMKDEYRKQFRRPYYRSTYHVH